MLPGLSIVLLEGGGLGVIPNAVSWADIDTLGFNFNAPQIISGIGEPILLRCEISALNETNLYSGSLTASADGDETAITVASGATGDFWVAPDASVFFTAGGRGPPGDRAFSYTATATIKYRLAGSSSFTETLDSFTFAQELIIE
jgi:hypothetical protein